MANSKKDKYVCFVRFINHEGKRVGYKHELRSPESMARFEAKMRAEKKTYILGYEIYLIKHLKKVNLRRDKKCDAKNDKG